MAASMAATGDMAAPRDTVMDGLEMLRTRGSFYAIDRTSPPRARLEEEDIQEVPGRGEARTQDEWTGPADEDTKDAGRARLEKAVKEHKRTDL